MEDLDVLSFRLLKNNMNIIISLLIGYIIGSIPAALVIGKVFYNKDVRQYGSGNLGGSNTGRVLGKKAGLAVMFLDVLKAIISISIIYILYKDLLYLLLCGISCNIGHCYPIFARFKGGKAVSTFVGYLIGISFYVYHDPLFFIIPVGIFIIVLYKTKIVSLSSMICALSVSLYIFIQLGFTPTFITTFILALFLIFRHRSNISRLKERNENKIKWM